MPFIKCMIIDDEPKAIDMLRHHVKQCPDLLLAATATNPAKALKLIGKYEIELLFLDVKMREMSGWEVKKAIDPRVQVIFCSAYADLGMDSYDAEATDYLVKPFTSDRFRRAIDRVRDRRATGNTLPATAAEGFVVLAAEGKKNWVHIATADIEIVEGKGNQSVMYTTDGSVIVNYSIGQVEKILPANQFIRIHNSHIVAVNRIHRYHQGVVFLRHSEFKELGVGGGRYQERLWYYFKQRTKYTI